MKEEVVPLDSPDNHKEQNISPSSGKADSLSITEALRTLGDNTDTANDNIRKEEINNFSDEAESKSPEGINLADLLALWSEFITQLKKEEPRMYSALRNQEPLLSNKNTINIFFRNNAQLDEFKQKIKPSLVSFLSNKLNNTQINLEADIYKEDKKPEAKFLNEMDKLKHMASKNPVLQKLKQDFNLDFE